METTAMPERRTYTIAEAARLLGISRGQAYMLARVGELPGVIKLGGRIVVAKPVLDRVIVGEEPSPDMREPGSFPGSKGSRDNDDVESTA